MMTVKISRRPMSMVKLRTHLLRSGSSAHVKAGPVSPSPGPQLPIADIDEPMAVLRSSPWNISISMHASATVKKTKVKPRVRWRNSDRRVRPSSMTLL